MVLMKSARSSAEDKESALSHSQRDKSDRRQERILPGLTICLPITPENSTLMCEAAVPRGIKSTPPFRLCICS